MTDQVTLLSFLIERNGDILVVPHQQTVAIVQLGRRDRDIRHVAACHLVRLFGFRLLEVHIGYYQYGMQLARNRHLFVNALLFEQVGHLRQVRTILNVFNHCLLG